MPCCASSARSLWQVYQLQAYALGELCCLNGEVGRCDGNSLDGLVCRHSSVKVSHCGCANQIVRGVPLAVRAGDKGSHFGRFRPEPVVHPGEPPVDGDAVRTLQQFLN